MSRADALMDSLRQKALHARRNMTPFERGEASEIITEKIGRSPLFNAATLIACYLPMGDEVDTRAIIARAWRANKRVFVPVMRNHYQMIFREIGPDTTLLRNRMKIWEPNSGDIVSPTELQVVITPTVAYDDDGHRIGMGGGYYDRCFSFLRHRKVWLKPKLLGVAFKCQKVEKITPNTWDIPLYRIYDESN